MRPRALEPQRFEQHSFRLREARTGSAGDAFGGSLGVPVYGELAKPAYNAWQLPSGYNDTAPWEVRARLLVGLQYGWNVWPTVPAILLDFFLVIDCIFLYIVYQTLERRINGSLAQADPKDGVDLMRNMAIRMSATLNVARYDRLYLSTVIWILVVIFRAVFVWAPWRFNSVLKRPECTPDGWQSDHESTVMQILATTFQILAIWGVAYGRRVEFDYNAHFTSKVSARSPRARVRAERTEAARRALN